MDARSGLIDLIRRERCDKRSAPVRLGPGGETDIYLDIKGLLTTSSRMRLAARAFLQTMYDADLRPTVVGGPTMGADVLSHAVVLETSLPLRWFSVRDHVKTSHGLGKWIEGAELGPRDRVIITDDVVNSGNSIAEAHEAVLHTGARVIAVMPLVERSDHGSKMFSPNYYPVITYADLGIQALAG